MKEVIEIIERIDVQQETKKQVINERNEMKERVMKGEGGR